MTKRIFALILCLTMLAGMIPAVSAAPIEKAPVSRDRCCQTPRSDLEVNYVRPDYDGYLIELTPQRVADTFAYLDEHYVRNHPEQALMVYTGTEEDREVIGTLARTITQGCATDKQKADAIDRWLYANILYDVNTSAYASDTFYRREGNCLSYANLMMFLLRSLGIPAVIGDGWRGDMQASTVDLFTMEGHAWCFVLLDGEWVLYDPLWLECGTTDREYMAQWIYFDTVENICPVSDGDNLPPEAYDKSKAYYTDGKFYIWSKYYGDTLGVLTSFINNQAFAYVSNQCVDGGYDGMYYLDGRDKSGMEQGELYRNGWVSYGDYNADSAMMLSYYFPNGMTADGYVTEFDGTERLMYCNTSTPILASDYDITDGRLTLKPGYTGPFLGVAWQEGWMDDRNEYVVTWESWDESVATVDQNGNITCLAEGWVDIRVYLERVERDGSLTQMAGTIMNLIVSDEERVPDYSGTQGPVTPPAEELSGTCGENVSWVLADGTLTISGTGAMYDYEYNEAPWYGLMEMIRRVEVTDGVTRIGQNAFRDMAYVTGASLSNTVTEIGNWAFMNLENLNAVTLPDRLTFLGQEAFRNCYALEEIELPGTLTFIDAGVFSGCESLTRAVIHADPDTPSLMIGNSPFRCCSSLRTIEVDKGHFALKSIDGVLYLYDGQGLSLLQYPGGKEDAVFQLPGETYEIQKMALEEVNALEEVIIPEGVQLVWDWAFANCANLRTIRFQGDAPEFREETFWAVTATAYYPAGNETWTEEVMQDYGGTITWVPYGEEEYLVDWYQATTSLEGAIDLNIYVELSENLVNAKNAWVRFLYAGKVVDVPMAEAVATTVNSIPMYRFSCEMYAKEVSETVTIQVMKGGKPVGEALEYSIMRYCMNRIRKSKDPKQVAVCKALLNYATAAQLCFGYNTNNLANTELQEADKILPANINLSGYARSVSGSQAGIKPKEATLMLEAVVSVRVYFTLDAGRNISDYTFTINGKTVQPQKNDKGWYVETDGIPAKELNQMFTFRVGGLTIRYGPLSYAQSKLTSQNSQMSDLAKALYAYHIAAKDLLG